MPATPKVRRAIGGWVDLHGDVRREFGLLGQLVTSDVSELVDGNQRGRRGKSMSGRIRSIKPEMLDDAITARLSSAAFRTFIALILLADDYGNFRAEPAQLRALIFWGSAPEAPIEVLLLELEKLVLWYSVRGQRYGSIRSWSRNQRVQRAGHPRVPGPDQADTREEESDSEIAASGMALVGAGRAETDSGDSPEDLRSESSTSPEVLRTDLRSPISDQGSSIPEHGSPTSPTCIAPEPLVSGSRDAPNAPCEAPSSPVQTHLALLPERVPGPTGTESLADETKSSRAADSGGHSAREREVFEHWLEGWRRIVHGARVPTLDDKRRRKIRARLADGFGVDDLKRAVDGLWSSDWHVENGRTDIELVCRDAGHVEQFMGVLVPEREIGEADERATAPISGQEFVPPPAKLLEVMESVRRAATPSQDEPGAPVLWKARPAGSNAPGTRRGAGVC